MWTSLIERLRRRRCPPEARLAEVGIAKGMRVADVGAGYGFFAFPAASAVGDEGVVYAIEPNPGRAKEISKIARNVGVKNLKVLERGAENLGEIATGEIDVAMSMSSFHHFADAKKGLLELKRIVKPGGVVYIRDVKRGRVFRHGSSSDVFRPAISEIFPSSEFEEEPRYITARSKL